MDDATFRELCDLVSEGKALRPLLRERGIGKDQFYDFKNADEARKKHYQVARDEGEEALALECLEIADDSRNDFIATLAENGDEKAAIAFANGENIQRSKLRIETRLKLLAKFNPKRWGDKIDLSVDAKVRGSVSYRANIPPRKPPTE